MPVIISSHTAAAAPVEKAILGSPGLQGGGGGGRRQDERGQGKQEHGQFPSSAGRTNL